MARLNKRIRSIIRRQKHAVWWGRIGPMTRLIGHLFPTAGIPVLVLSLPRSGSSWLGEILGRSANGLYLREPISDAYLRDEPESGTVFEVRPDSGGFIPERYCTAGEKAFMGHPGFPLGVRRPASQWRLRDRRSKRLIIKEVNPLALRWLSESFEFKLIYLIRHPGSVAASWRRLDWSEVGFDQIVGPSLHRRVNREHERQFWSWHGALQALVHNYVYDELSTWDSDLYTVVTYETLCVNPEAEVEKLFRFADLPWTNDDRLRVHSHSTAVADRSGDPYGTKRVSTSMPDRWRHELTESEIALLREAYLYYEPPVYTTEW